VGLVRAPKADGCSNEWLAPAATLGGRQIPAIIASAASSTIAPSVMKPY